MENSSAMLQDVAHAQSSPANGTPFESLQSTVMFLSNNRPWHKVILAAMHTANSNGYPEQGKQLCHDFSKQWCDAYDRDAVDAKIEESARKCDNPVTFRTLRHFATIEYNERLLQIIPQPERLKSDVAVALAYVYGSNNKNPDFKQLWTELCHGTEEAWSDAVRIADPTFRKLPEIASAHDQDAVQALHEAYEAGKPPKLPPTFHDPSVKFDEDYDEPQMRPYNVTKPIQCIVGPWGIGKTETLEQMIQMLGESTSVIVVTYSVALAAAMVQRLARNGFKSYEKPGSLSDKRLVVCLDSLYRVTGTYDLVIMDEGLSVLQHFNSSMMRHKTAVCEKFRYITLNAKRLLFLDANCDNQLVKRFVDQLSRERMLFAITRGEAVVDQTPYWVRNRHSSVAKYGAEHVTITVNRIPTHKAAFAEGFIAKVMGFVAEGKRVAVACSNKTMVDALKERLSKEEALAGRFMCWGDVLGRCAGEMSTEDDALFKLHMQDVNKHWMPFQVIVYSPALTSGVSFTQPAHFHSRLCYFSNSDYTAPVDSCLQQMFRVRSVSSMETHVYVESSRVYKYDDTLSGVEWALDCDDTYLKELHVANNITGCTRVWDANCRLVYQRDNMFYSILVGLLMNVAQSHNHFLAMLVSALRVDRGAHVDVVDFAPVAIKCVTTSTPIAKPTVEIHSVPSHDVYESLKDLAKGKVITPQQKQLIFNYDVVVDLYGAGHYDTAFIDKYVGPAMDKGSATAAHLTFLQFYYFRERTRLDAQPFFDKHHVRYSYAFDPMGATRGVKVLHFNGDAVKKGAFRAMEAVHLIEQLVGPDADNNFFSNLRRPPHTVSLNTKHVKDAVFSHLNVQTMPRARFDGIVCAFGFRWDQAAINEAVAESGAYLKKDSMCITYYVKKVLGLGLGLKVNTPRGGDNGKMIISASEFFELYAKYRPAKLTLVQ